MALIQISDSLWEYLNRQKKPGDTFEEVLNDLLKQKRIEEAKNNGT